MTKKKAYQNRTAIVHFGPTKQDYLDLVSTVGFELEAVKRYIREQDIADKGDQF